MPTGALTPEEQADTLFYYYTVGAKISDMPPHTMSPETDGIWELRSHDLRFFGWFWREKIFIISAIEQAKKCKDFNLYAGYRDQAKNDRENLDLDPPKFITGDRSDVL